MKKTVVLLTSLLLGFCLFSEVQVKLNHNTLYDPGDIITLDLVISSDKEFNQVFFDLDFDSEVLEFLGYRDGNLTTGSDSTVLIASNDKKVILSTLWNENLAISQESIILAMEFKVKKESEASGFYFTSYGVQAIGPDGNGVDLEVTFQDSDLFTVPPIESDSYIWIRNPGDGTVISSLEPLTLLFTKGKGYSVVVRNDSYSKKSEKIDSELGFIEGIELPMVEGENHITAQLYKGDKVVAIDSAIIKYIDSNNQLEIEYPLNNSVVSQNRVSVKVASAYSSVLVNKEEAYFGGYKNKRELDIYYRDIWLKPGFNTIIVEAKGKDNFVYSKSINLYYEKRDEVFRINYPDKSIRWKKDSHLSFKGEISNKYNEDGSLTDITYDLIFYPASDIGHGISIVSKGYCVIEEATTLDNIESAFTFRNKEPIDIGKLGAGTLEIIASYNNKESRRIVTIDDSKLQIKIDQPALYLEDNLKSFKIIENFNSSGEIVRKNIAMTPSGEIGILKGNRVIYETPTDGWEQSKRGLLELSNSDLLYFTNKNGIARLKVRKSGEEKWLSYWEDSNRFYIYDIRETSKGLLLGVSNYNADGNSGLYLLKDGVLTNIVIGEPISHVQFIRTIGDTVFLYGNLYSNIYSFNLNSLEKNNEGRLSTASVTKIALDNSLSLRDFNISQTLNSVALLTTNNKLQLYSIKNGNTSLYEPFDGAVFENVESITPGEYKNSSYSGWLIQGSTTHGKRALYTVMEHKDNGELKASILDLDTIPSEDILSHGYFKDNFYILYKKLNSIRLAKGKFFFKNFLIESDEEFNLDPGIVDLEVSSNKLCITNFNGVFWGDGFNKPLYNLRTEIMDRGDISFSYTNRDSSGYKGLSFSIPSIWLNSDNINLKIDIKSPIDSFKLDSSGYQTLRSWIEDNREGDYYDLYQVYDSTTDKSKIDIHFKDLWVNSSIDFNYSILARGDLSPTISDIKVTKKVPVKLPLNNNGALLTIKGEVSDPTISTIRVSGSTEREVHVNSRGGFVFDCKLNGYNSENSIGLIATNSQGETAYEEFKVLLFDSVLGMGNVNFKALNRDFTEYKTDLESINVSFNYYGLKGAVVGYEILTLNGNVIVNKGLFKSKIDSEFNRLLYSGNITNLESGKVVDGNIKLIPGGQRVRIFVENPGGKREYYYDSPGKLPVVIYNLNKSDESIIFTNSDCKDVFPTEDQPEIYQEMDVQIRESNLSYKKRLSITGEIESLERVNDLIVSSGSSNITLGNGLIEEIIHVDDLNRFSFYIDIELEESAIFEKSYYITVEPSAPYQSYLKRVIRLNISKDFTGAVIVPDFSLMDDSLYPWGDIEKKFLNKPIRVIFERILPPEATLDLVINFNKTITGKLIKLPGVNRTYKLVDNKGAELGLSGIKFGQNRIRWTLFSRGDLVSASTMSSPYMKDFTFELSGSSSFTPTTVTTDLKDIYYTSDTLPTIDISRDITTNLTMELNGSSRELNETSLDLKKESLLEGANDLTIKSDKEKGLGIKYRILYDSKKPQIGELFYKLDEDNNITHLGSYIKEANIDRVKLFLKNTLLNQETQITTVDYSVEALSNSIYRISWPDIGSINPKLNPLETNNPFRIEVIDKVQRSTTTEYIYGSKNVDNNPFGEIGIISDLSDCFNKDSIDLDYRVKDDIPGKDHWVFYGSSVNIIKGENGAFNKNILEDTTLNISRPGIITLSDIELSDKIEAIEVRGDAVQLNSNFSLEGNKTLKIYPKSNYPEPPLPYISIDKEYKEFSINFQLRIDDFGTFEYGSETKKRVVTFPTSVSSDTNYYLGYEITGNVARLYLCRSDGKSEPIGEGFNIEEWRSVLVNISQLGIKREIQVFINDKGPYTFNLVNDISSDFLIPKDSRIFFGDENKNNNGHFTISAPFYVDRVISSGDLPSYIKRLNADHNMDIDLSFTSSSIFSFNNSDEFGEEPYKLRSYKKNHRVTDREDINYDINGSALVASNYNKNYIGVKGDSFIFKDCEIPVTKNLKEIVYNINEGYIPLKTLNSGSGRYTFGNRPTNHGIGNNQYYTVSGRIERINPGNDSFDASITVIINNRIQKFPLKEGDFSFVYEHDKTPPETVILFLETDKDIYLYDNFQFVEGNAKLNRDTLMDNPSLVSTKYYFLNSGTIELYYKPFNINPLGFVDYEGTIIDTTSDFIQIFTEYNSSLDFVEYVGKVGNHYLRSNTPVKEGWHKLLLTYSVKDRVVRFYIDDELKAEAPGNISLDDVNSSSGDNLYIGGDITRKSYSQGYIDDVKITNLFNTTTTYLKDIDFIYKEDDKIAGLNLIGKEEILNSDWNIKIREVLPTNRLTSPLRYESNSSNLIPLELKNRIDPGLYFARFKGVYNNKRVNSIFHFIKDDKPDFKIISNPKLIVGGEESSLKFKTQYDSSFLVNKVNSNRYPAFIIEVYDKNHIESERIFVCKDIVTKPNSKWKFKREGEPDWEEITSFDGILNIAFTKRKWESEVIYNYSSFYYVNDFNEEQFSSENYILDLDNHNTIPMASLNELKIFKEESTGKEFKLEVSLKNAYIGDGIGSTDFKIRYRVIGHGEAVEIPFTSSGFIDLYYDDLLKGLPYNNKEETYRVVVNLISGAESLQEKSVEVSWKEIIFQEKVIEKKSSLAINSLDLLYLKEEIIHDEVINIASLYSNIEYIDNSESPDVDLRYSLKVYNSLNNIIYSIKDIEVSGSTASITIDRVKLGTGNNRVYLKVFDNNSMEVSDIAYINISTSTEAPEIFFTNNHPYYTSYNNLIFTWDGKYRGVSNQKILYSYNLDNQGWSSLNSDSKNLDIYNLDEGFHILRVKGSLNSRESSEIITRIFVDTQNPQINLDNVEFVEKRDMDGIIKSILISGNKGALTDSSLSKFYINGVETDFNKDGEFYSVIPIYKEGISNISFEAVDKVGNRTILKKKIDNTFIEIISPGSEFVKYSPLTLVGKISDTITQSMKIFIEDPLYKGEWHEAKINSDRVFFIDDIKVNPGSLTRNSVTNIRLKAKMSSGKEYFKDIKVTSGNLFRPLRISLSNKATQGAGKPIDIEITADCEADISSWSIDFDGDGIYDDTELVDTGTSYRKVWRHSYSKIGEVSPRVRVITRDGDYFTDSSTLIIHDVIKAASSITIPEPVDMGVANMDRSNKFFVLSGKTQKQIVDVFEVGSTNNYFSNKLYSIPLGSKIQGDAKSITVLNSDSFIITSEHEGRGYIYQFSINEYGNYEIIGHGGFEKVVSSVSKSPDNLIFTYSTTSEISLLPIRDGNIDLKSIKTKDLILPIGNELLPPGCEIAYSKGVIYVADYLRQTIVEFNEDLVATNYWGEFGYNDGEFISPFKISEYGNRIFIYDNSREDIQVFNMEKDVITSINGYGDYLPKDFFSEIVSIESIGREEGGRLFYYIAALSKESESLSLVRLPSWEELRAKTRNNKIVFIKDKEVFTAKPDGSDLRKVLSTDSLPRIEGSADYPTISPDGRTLAFICKDRIFTGEISSSNDETHSYDNLYIIEHDGEIPKRIPLSIAEGYEIERPVFNSNGDTIAFSARKEGGYWQIYEYRLEDGTVSKLFNSSENLRFPYYSPDDRFIVYSTDFDGDEDLEIFDKKNPDVRIEVTSNNYRDSYPVWSRISPFEIPNQESKIKSKIAFVSDRGYKKGIYYTYISLVSENDLRVVTKDELDVGNTPDIAAVRITDNCEGDYPLFTGDGSKIVYEYNDGSEQGLNNWDSRESLTRKMNLPLGSMRPSGMRNNITGYSGTVINGNEVRLTWKPYTDHKAFYILQYKKSIENLNFTQKKIYSQDGTTVTGLEMNTEYLMRVVIEENEEIVAGTRWIKIKVPEVIARPSYSIDRDNPYLVHLLGWKPKEETNWSYSWIIDNQEVDSARTSQEFSYQFGTSGEKSIQLKATNREGTFTSISSPMTVNIVSDIKPVIEYAVINTPNGGIVLDLDASNSVGKRINYATVDWTITGAGGQLIKSDVLSPSLDLSDFSGRISVNLKLSRQKIYGREETDTLEVNRIIDLTYEELKPVITYLEAEDNPRLIEFDGTSSLGNIDWRTSKWTIFSDGNLIYTVTGLSNISYLFPEYSGSGNYAVSLAVLDNSTGISKTTSQIVYVEPRVIEPIITSEVITLKDKDDNDIGVKVVLTATNSKGSSIDFSMSEWNLPLASQYGDQPKQRGATAIFNLSNPGERSSVDVSLTLYRRGGIDAVTSTETVYLNTKGLTETEILVKAITEKTSDGNAIIMDVLDSKGVDIDWSNTTWLIDGEFSYKGPVIRLDKGFSTDKQRLVYSVTLNRFSGKPITRLGEISLDSYNIKPHIDIEDLSDDGLTKRLSITQTSGVNIDWGRTKWSIWDGNDDIIQKRGATIIHKFTPRDKALGYPILAELYFKGSDKPIYAYKSIQIEGDTILPIIQWDRGLDDYKNSINDKGDSQVISFSALNSIGSGIDWSQSKWNFGDGSSPAFGGSVQHKYPVSNSVKKYNISLTLYRNSRNGNKESKTIYKTIEIGKEEITPVITARIDTKSNTLVLSAEASEGRGLLLDRTVWVFAGEGESENFSRSKSEVETEGVSSSSSTNSGVTIGANATVTAGQPGVASASFGTSLSASLNIGSNKGSNSSSQNSNNNNLSYTTNNNHVGAICRRYVEDFNFDNYTGSTDEEKMIWVTLFVYRLNSDGGMTGRSITERINIKKIKEASKLGKSVEYK